MIWAVHRSNLPFSGQILRLRLRMTSDTSGGFLQTPVSLSLCRTSHGLNTGSAAVSRDHANDFAGGFHDFAPIFSSGCGHNGGKTEQLCEI